MRDESAIEQGTDDRPAWAVILAITEALSSLASRRQELSLKGERFPVEKRETCSYITLQRIIFLIEDLSFDVTWVAQNIQSFPEAERQEVAVLIAAATRTAESMARTLAHLKQIHGQLSLPWPGRGYQCGIQMFDIPAQAAPVSLISIQAEATAANDALNVRLTIVADRLRAHHWLPIAVGSTDRAAPVVLQPAAFARLSGMAPARVTELKNKGIALTVERALVEHEKKDGRRKPRDE